MESSPGKLLGLQASRPHMEPGALCPTAAPLAERLFRVLVGVTGSVAALKLPLLVSRLMDIPGLEVAVVTTERAKHFYSSQDIPVTLYSDADEWEMWRHRSDPVLHIDLRRWADLMLVAPLDANTLGKVASGICDNLLARKKYALLCGPVFSDLGRSYDNRVTALHNAGHVLYVTCTVSPNLRASTVGQQLADVVMKHSDLEETCVIRAWDRRKPLLFCPAMNTTMWEHPITSQQVGQLQAFGYIEIPCVAKMLVCGDQGLGAMAEVDTIVDKVKEVLFQHTGSQQN